MLVWKDKVQYRQHVYLIHFELQKKYIDAVFE